MTPRAQHAVGSAGTTMQAKYEVVADGECMFTPRFPWSFRRGERPVGYKGVVGNHPTLFFPHGIARWKDGLYEADAYIPTWRFALLSGFAVVFLLMGASSAVHRWESGGGLDARVLGAAVAFLPSLIPFFVGVWWWSDHDSQLFRAMAEEVAKELEGTSSGLKKGDAQQDVAADGARS